MDALNPGVCTATTSLNQFNPSTVPLSSYRRAAAAGFDSLLIAGGIHASQLLCSQPVAASQHLTESGSARDPVPVQETNLMTSDSDLGQGNMSAAILQMEDPQVVNGTALNELCIQYSTWPTYVMSKLAV